MSQLIRIDLTELGEGQYIEIKDPKALPWKFQRELVKSVGKESLDDQMDAMEKMSIKLIKNGNVQDEDGQVVSFPVTTDTVGLLPIYVIQSVMQKYTEIVKGEKLPNA